MLQVWDVASKIQKIPPNVSFLVKGSMRTSKLSVPREAVFKRAPQYGPRNFM